MKQNFYREVSVYGRYEYGSRKHQNGYIVDGIITKGLNLLVVPNGEEVFCFTFSIALCVANGIKFLDRETRQYRVRYFALGDGSRKRTRQQIADIAGSDENLKNVTVIYAYESGSFGNKMEDGMEVFLYDNPQTKMIVIDSLHHFTTFLNKRYRIRHFQCIINLLK